MPEFPRPPDWAVGALRAGLVIPAHPLALTAARKLDERRQRALTRYYHAAGAGGIAIGVHTTQFAIREPRHGLFKPVLQLAAETISACDSQAKGQTVRIAGICGKTGQAVTEAVFARETGFHAGLLSLASLSRASDDELVTHCEIVAREIALFGFYLQPAVGGRVLSRAFWRRFVEIPNVVGIKIAPFNRYQTLAVLRAVAETPRAGDLALYTGNDDNILIDLLTEFQLRPASAASGVKGSPRDLKRAPAEPLRLVGGLLGHWSCWTRRAVELLGQVKARKNEIPAALLTLAAQITESNAALFDAANHYAGSVPGIHEVLRRQGLLEGVWCLDEDEKLSPGQAEEIERVCQIYPHLTDDEFVEEHRDEWLGP